MAPAGGVHREGLSFVLVMRYRIVLCAVAALLGCTRYSRIDGPAPGALPDSLVEQVKLAALPNLYAELRTRGDWMRVQLLVDSIVGPTPRGIPAPVSHTSAWLDSAVAALRAHSVSALVRRSVSDAPAAILSVGQPYRIAADRFGIQFVLRAATVDAAPAANCGTITELQLQRTPRGYRQATLRRIYVGCSDSVRPRTASRDRPGTVPGTG